MLLAAGCAATNGRLIPPAGLELPVRVGPLPVPFVPQSRYQCGPATLAMALDWTGTPVDLDALTREVYTPELKGSLQFSLVSAARRQGRIAYPIARPEDLFAEITAGHPVVVLQNLGLSWLPSWHYALVIGYDRAAGVVFLHSGRTATREVSLATFERTWARGGHWGLLVLSPEDLPAIATEESFLEAVVGLERTQKWEEAARGYRAGLQRWPQSLTTTMGLGNTLYRLGSLAAAEAAFQQATEIDPDYAPAYNNLAQVLADLGFHDEALVAARSAVSLGGPFATVYEKTLREISAGRR